MAELRENPRKAFVLRISPGKDQMDEALRSDDIIIGWSKARGLLNTELDWQQFRQIIHDIYHKNDTRFHCSGRAASTLWYFIRDMNEGDLVVVPYGNACYVAEVAGPARHEDSKIVEDTAHRRRVRWLNNKESILRRYARAALQSRMKARQTCVDASDLVADVQELLKPAGTVAPPFLADLRRKLIERTLEEIRSGRINDRGFEKLVATVLKSLGGISVCIVPRRLDKGADILSTFSVATSFKFRLAVQAKHYQPKPPVGADVVDKLVQGMEAENADLGWVATCGTFSEEVTRRKEALEDDCGCNIELIDGEQLAAMIVDGGLRMISESTSSSLDCGG